jgi:hypothetical protein
MGVVMPEVNHKDVPRAGYYFDLRAGAKGQKMYGTGTSIE